MSREILLLVDALAREKNVNRDVVFGALELALASATKKRFSEDVDIRVEVKMRQADAQGRRRFVGTLRGLDGAAATVVVDGAAVALPLDGMERARLVPEL